MEKKATLAEDFSDYFEIYFANTDELKNEAYKIRYRVYCEEFGYEPIASFPNGRETDEFDLQSLHCVIIHSATKMPAGCVRLVPPLQNGRLPMEKFCQESLDQAFIESLELNRDKICEVSRLAVDGAFRRRAGEARTRFGEIDAIDCSHRERRTFSLISMVSFLAATALTDLTGRRNVFAMMEPFLPRMLQKSGIHFRKVGQEIDYHGIRAPYFARTIEDGLATMHPDLKELYSFVFSKIKGQFGEQSQ